jgi:tetratricopeptide (TPR) repeat protein
MLNKTYWWLRVLTAAIATLTTTTSAYALGKPQVLPDIAQTPTTQPDNSQQALGQYLEGVKLQQQGQLDAAIAAYQKALRLNPNMAEAYLNMGAALAAQGKQTEAIAAYRQAITRNPNIPQAHHNLGNALAQQGQYDEAIAAYQQAIRINPNYAKAYFNLGNIQAKQGQTEPAIANWQQAIRTNPNFAEAYANLGITLNRQGRRQEATEALKKARDLFKAQNKPEQVEQMERILQRLERDTVEIT